MLVVLTSRSSIIHYIIVFKMTFKSWTRRLAHLLLLPILLSLQAWSLFLAPSQVFYILHKSSSRNPSPVLVVIISFFFLYTPNAFNNRHGAIDHQYCLLNRPRGRMSGNEKIVYLRSLFWVQSEIL